MCRRMDLLSLPVQTGEMVPARMVALVTSKCFFGTKRMKIGGNMVRSCTVSSTEIFSARVWICHPTELRLPLVLGAATQVAPMPVQFTYTNTAAIAFLGINLEIHLKEVPQATILDM